MNKERLMFPGVMYVKDRSNRTVTTVGQKIADRIQTLSTKRQTQSGKGSVY